MATLSFVALTGVVGLCGTVAGVLLYLDLRDNRAARAALKRNGTESAWLRDQIGDVVLITTSVFLRGLGSFLTLPMIARNEMTHRPVWAVIVLAWTCWASWRLLRKFALRSAIRDRLHRLTGETGV